jgi:hypothetical protein
MSIRRIVGIGLTSAAMIVGSATAAFAGGTPTPSPVVTPHFGYQPKPVPVNWQFDLEQTDIGTHHLAEVEGTGAIPMADWQDVQLSPTVDKFVLGPNSVTLKHSALPLPTIDLKKCTVEFAQRGYFRIIAGTGTGAHLRSLNGTFELQAMLSFAEKAKSVYNLSYGNAYHVPVVCPVSANPFVVRNEVNTGHGLPQPTFDDVSVQGEALVVSTLPVVHVFSPSATPSASTTYPTHS